MSGGNSDNNNDKNDEMSKGLQSRRTLVGRAVGLSVIAVAGPVLDSVPAAQAQQGGFGESKKKAKPPEKQRPQPGDVLVFSKGDRKDQVITPDDLPTGGQPIIAFPMEPASGVVRRGSRLNRVSVLRVDAALLTERMNDKAADGIVAYSAICTHGGCLVEMWREEDQALFCPCHYSRYDAWDLGAVKGGPAPRRLANLPMKLVDGQLQVAAVFDAKIGNR